MAVFFISKLKSDPKAEQKWIALLKKLSFDQHFLIKILGAYAVGSNLCLCKILLCSQNFEQCYGIST